MRLLVYLLLLLRAALDAFCESLDAAEIMPYMPQLISELLQVLQMGQPGVQEMALSAVSSIAAAAEQAFQPYTGKMPERRQVHVTAWAGWEIKPFVSVDSTLLLHSGCMSCAALIHRDVFCIPKPDTALCVSSS
jgi:hypothetical protein